MNRLELPIEVLQAVERELRGRAGEAPEPGKSLLLSAADSVSSACLQLKQAVGVLELGMTGPEFGLGEPTMK